MLKTMQGGDAQCQVSHQNNPIGGRQPESLGPRLLREGDSLGLPGFDLERRKARRAQR